MPSKHIADQLNELNSIIALSLQEFLVSINALGWSGREREAVSLYTFGHLAQKCRKGAVLNDIAQIGIEVAVPQMPGPGRKKAVCKDLVIWSEPRATCWDDKGRPTNYPICIMEWKYPRSGNPKAATKNDIDWLFHYSRSLEYFVGHSVLLTRTDGVYRMTCVAVHAGKLDQLTF